MLVHSLLWFVSWSLYALGLVGSILPGLLELSFIRAGILFHKMWLGTESMPWWFVALATVVFLLGFLL